MLTANVGRAFDEGYVTAIKDVAHGSFRVPASMTVKEFLQKTGIDPDRLRSSDPMVLPRTSQPSTPGNKP
jgi:hypothetical protein